MNEFNSHTLLNDDNCIVRKKCYPRYGYNLFQTDRFDNESSLNIAGHSC